MHYDDEFGKLQMFPLLFEDGSLANCQRATHQIVGVVVGKIGIFVTRSSTTVREHLRHDIMLPRVPNKTWRLVTKEDFELIKTRIHTLNDQLKSLGFKKVLSSANTYFETNGIIVPDQQVLFVTDV